MSPINPNQRSVATRLLHVGLLLAVLWQLIGSNFMEAPRPGVSENGFYEVHEIVGIATLSLVIAFWIWTALRRRETPIGALFPWFSAPRRSAVWADLKTHWEWVRQFKLPTASNETPLASAVHGLGLLTALAMGATGALLFTQDVPGGLTLEVHKTIATLMWAYVVGHSAIAVVHELAGHQVFRRMFGAGAQTLDR